MEIRNNEPLDKALKRFKKMCDREGLNRDVRRMAYYEKTSEQKKRKKREREKEVARQARQRAKKLKKARARRGRRR
jgi:small subunit ribosomal protein S21